MQKSTLTFLLFLGTMIAADNCQAFPIDEEWTPVTDIYNHSLSGFIQREELSHCFDRFEPPNLLKLVCYYRDGLQTMSTFFCVLIRDGIMCM